MTAALPAAVLDALAAGPCPNPQCTGESVQLGVLDTGVILGPAESPAHDPVTQGCLTCRSPLIVFQLLDGTWVLSTYRHTGPHHTVDRSGNRREIRPSGDTCVTTWPDSWPCPDRT